MPTAADTSNPRNGQPCAKKCGLGPANTEITPSAQQPRKRISSTLNKNCVLNVTQQHVKYDRDVSQNGYKDYLSVRPSNNLEIVYSRNGWQWARNCSSNTLRALMLEASFWFGRRQRERWLTLAVFHASEWTPMGSKDRHQLAVFMMIFAPRLNEAPAKMKRE